MFLAKAYVVGTEENGLTTALLLSTNLVMMYVFMEK